MENQAVNAAIEAAPLMHWIDAAALGTLALSALLALFRGFTKEFFQVVNVVTAMFVSAVAMPYALPYVEEVAPEGWISKAITGTVIFIVVAVIMSLISGQIARAIRKSSLSMLDRSLGFAFGLVRGAFIICLAYIVLVLVSNPERVEAMVSKARSGNLIVLGAHTIIQLLPEQTVEALGLTEVLEPAREQAGEKPSLTDVRAVAPGSKNTETAPAQTEEPGAASPPKPETRGKDDDEGYKDLERRALDALLDAARDQR
jgi:membrane protein required for colicin V production